MFRLTRLGDKVIGDLSEFYETEFVANTQNFETTVGVNGGRRVREIIVIAIRHVTFNYLVNYYVLLGAPLGVTTTAFLKWKGFAIQSSV